MLACCRVTCKRRFSPGRQEKKSVCGSILGPSAGPYRERCGPRVWGGLAASGGATMGTASRLPPGHRAETQAPDGGGRRFHQGTHPVPCHALEQPPGYDAMHQREGSHPTSSEVFLAPCTASHDSPLTTAAKTIKARYEIRPPSESMRSS